MSNFHIGTKLCMLLLVIGALNWGLVGIFNFNFIDFVFGTSIFTRITYIVVGLAGLYTAIRLPMIWTSREESGHPAT